MAAAPASVPVDIVMTKGTYVRAGETYAPGDHLTAPKGLADQLIACGAAARSGDSQLTSSAKAAMPAAAERSRPGADACVPENGLASDFCSLLLLDDGAARTSFMSTCESPEPGGSGG